MAYLQWLQGEVRTCCPLCGEEGPKSTVLATDHVLPGHSRITLLRCPACGVAFLQDLTPPDYEISVAQQLDYYVEQGAGIDCIVAPLLRLPPESVRRCLDVGCSFGFAIDFSRYAFGWEVLGIDPSPLADAPAAAPPGVPRWVSRSPSAGTPSGGRCSASIPRRSPRRAPRPWTCRSTAAISAPIWTSAPSPSIWCSARRSSNISPRPMPRRRPRARARP